MTIKQEIINDCLDVLYSANRSVYDYWIRTLFNDDWTPIPNEWNYKNLKIIQKDVEMQTFCNV